MTHESLPDPVAARDAAQMRALFNQTWTTFAATHQRAVALAVAGQAEEAHAVLQGLHDVMEGWIHVVGFAQERLTAAVASGGNPEAHRHPALNESGGLMTHSHVTIDPADVVVTVERLFAGLCTADPKFDAGYLAALLLAYSPALVEFTGDPAPSVEVALTTGRHAWPSNARVIASALGTQQLASTVGLALCSLFLGPSAYAP